MNNHPNLLFILTDEQRADTFPAYGHRQIHMPNLEALASQSFVFDDAYCTQPVCTPSRSSILSGLFPHATGAFQNNKPLHPSIRCLPELLSDSVRSKYSTGYFGKWHLGDEIFAQHGFDTWTAFDDGYLHHYSEGRNSNARSDYHHWLVERGFKPDHKEQRFTRALTCNLPEPYTKPAFLADRAGDYIRENQHRPFIMYVNFLEPHMPFFGPRTEHYNPDEVELYPNYGRVPDENHHLKLRIEHEKNKRAGWDWYDLSSEAGWRQVTAAYFGLNELVDHHTGRILQQLAACGLEDNTIVVFTSDHGELMGSYGCVGKNVMQRESIRVPLMVRVPGQKSGRRVSGPFSQVDLVPTLLELMGQEVPEGLHGSSCARELSGTRNFRLENDAFLQWNWSDREFQGQTFPEWMVELAGSNQAIIDAQTEAIRTIITPDGWRFSVSPKLGQHELYHIAEDPLEQRNLARDPSNENRMNELLARIKAWQRRVQDAAGLPERICAW